MSRDGGPRESQGELNVVTGAFSHSGKYITARLLENGKSVRTLTGHPARPHPFGPRVETFGLDFDDPERLAAALEGATTLYNTYWVRFERRSVTFAGAVENTATLVGAAKRAGVKRIVHLSVTNPSPDSAFPYFRAKAEAERTIQSSGVSYAIVRPALIFGPEDVLINNIAWILRRFPVFAIPGSGNYPLQPVFVEDLADLCVEMGSRHDNLVIDAVGPEIVTFEQMVSLIAASVSSRARRIHLPAVLASVGARLVGAIVRDVVLTKDELDGLMAGLCVSKQPPTAPTELSRWLAENRSTLGLKWASELHRHYRP